VGTPFDLSVTDKLLTTTRAVRKRLDLQRPVEPELILDCIRIAQQAPTGGNAQNWHFVVVTDADKRAKLAEIYRSVGDTMLRKQRDAATDPQTRRVYESAVYLAEHLADVPVLVIPCARGRLPETPGSLAMAAFYANIIPAAWSFMLAARSRGLGTVWTSLNLIRESDTAAVLGLPGDVTPVALIPVAYYTGDDFSPAKRPPPESITSWNTWTG
jgi:nitroreductase